MNSRFELVTALQSLLIEKSGGRLVQQHDKDMYTQIRQELVNDSLLRTHLPSLIQQCRTLSQVLHEVEKACMFYTERESYIYEQFSSLFDMVEQVQVEVPWQSAITKLAERADPLEIYQYMQSILESVNRSPIEAIVRTLNMLEAICAEIVSDEPFMDQANLRATKENVEITYTNYETGRVSVAYIGYCPREDIFNKLKGYFLYRVALEAVRLDSDTQLHNQYMKPLFQDVVQPLKWLRNAIAHGGRGEVVEPSAREAIFVVHAAIGATEYLLESYHARKEELGL